MEEASCYKNEIEAQIAQLQSSVSELPGKANKSARSVIEKQIFQQRRDLKYIDACRVARGDPPLHGFFVDANQGLHQEDDPLANCDLLTLDNEETGNLDKARNEEHSGVDAVSCALGILQKHVSEGSVKFKAGSDILQECEGNIGTIIETLDTVIEAGSISLDNEMALVAVLQSMPSEGVKFDLALETLSDVLFDLKERGGRELGMRIGVKSIAGTDMFTPLVFNEPIVRAVEVLEHIARCKKWEGSIWDFYQSGRIRLFKPGGKAAILLNHSVQSSLGRYLELNCALSAPDPGTDLRQRDNHSLGERSVVHMIEGRPLPGLVVAALRSLQRESLQRSRMPIGVGKAVRQERRALMKEYREEGARANAACMAQLSTSYDPVVD